MNTAPDVMDRTAIPAGKVFIKAGAECERAYIIQVGEVIAYTMQGEDKVVVGRFGPGTMIGELCLAVDDPIMLNYEAVVTTTVMTITRQDFQKRLSKVDKTVKTILEQAVRKINNYERTETEKALKAWEVDETALLLVQSLTKGLPEEKRLKFEKAMLPHINGLIKEIKAVKSNGQNA